MFKIISTEIKKIVAKPGIYILSILLAVILILGVFIYKPTVYNSNHFELSGSRYIEKYDDFYRGSNAGKKAEATTNLNNAIAAINRYTVEESSIEYSQKAYITLLLSKVQENYASYQDCITDDSTQPNINLIRSNLVNNLETLNTSIENGIRYSQYGSFPILTTTENYNNYKSSYKLVVAWAKVSVEKENLKKHFIEFEQKYKANFYGSIDGFKYPTLSAEFVADYTTLNAGTKYSILSERLNAIENAITLGYQNALASTKENIATAKKMDELANLYVDTVNTYVSLIKYELITNAFDIVSTKEHLTTLHLSSYSNYNSKSMLQRCSYLFENNKNESQFAKPLTIGLASNNKINAYDYSYFVLKIFSFVIIIYAIMSACHSIAGELKEGSLRYLAIRPINRTNMLFGKWLSIIIMSSILMLFSFIISICVGGAVYGFASNPILTIFNGSFAFTIHPVGMIFIFLLSMLLELVIYSLIAMLFSTLFKSDLLSMTILLVIYLLNILLPIFVQGSNTWLAFYPFSHISLYSLFGSSVYAVPGNFFNLVFGAKIYAGSHILLTLSVILLISIIVSLCANKLFKKKEL